MGWLITWILKCKYQRTHQKTSRGSCHAISSCAKNEPFTRQNAPFFYRTPLIQQETFTGLHLSALLICAIKTNHLCANKCPIFTRLRLSDKSLHIPYFQQESIFPKEHCSVSNRLSNSPHSFQDSAYPIRANAQFP